jgi:hypothetical protein
MIVLSGCSGVNRKLGIQDDNLAEEIVEEAIQAKTGLDIDLTPATPEKENSQGHLLEEIEGYFLEPESTPQEKTRTQRIHTERLPTIHLCT